MKLIVRYCKPYVWRMLYGFLIKIVGTFADLGLPWVLSHIGQCGTVRRNPTGALLGCFYVVFGGGGPVL